MILAIIVLEGLFTGHSLADAEAPPAGRIIDFKGQVRMIPLAQEEILPRKEQPLAAGDMVITGGDGWAAILMADETLVQLNRNTRFALKAVDATAGWHKLRGPDSSAAQGEGRSVYQVAAGEMWLRNKNQNARITVETPTISAGIRGTEVDTVVFEDHRVTMAVLEGEVQGRNSFGEIAAGPGEMIVAEKGVAPRKRVLVSPPDAVQWTLAVPPMDDRYTFPMVSNDQHFLKEEPVRLIDALSKSPGDRSIRLRLAQLLYDRKEIEPSERMFQEVLGISPQDPAAETGLGWIRLDQGKTAEALSLFESVKNPFPHTILGNAVALTRMGRYDQARSILSQGVTRYPEFAAFQLQKASIALGEGDLILAKRHLEEDFKKRAGHGPAHTLLALIAIARGDASVAVQEAQSGVRFSPHSPAAYMVLCQAQKALFDLDSAMESVTEAIRLDPSYVPALVLKAELLFGSDQTEKAREVSDAAYRLAPKDPDLLNLRGFLLLSLREIEQAAEVFSQALKQAPKMAEPRLGMALIHMRQGKVAEALEEITTAVLLDPRRASFMSYWAKMLYQVKRFDRALEALAYAEKLDPMDPTPLLYRAIILRDLNRPTEALLSLNRAVALNGNRAVYRSRFLLDKDLAVKNVNQTVIFSDLGLTEWAKSKALASVKTDYHNSAAHTFLAGSLLAMNDRLRAGASENLLGMMMQQANLNSLNTFQEYTSFFEKPSLLGSLSGTYGNFDTLSGETFVSGAIPSANLAFNTILDGAKTDGWRETNGTRTQGAGAVVKWDPTIQDGLLLISSVLNTRSRDTRSDPYEYDSASNPGDWRRSRSSYTTMGYHRRFSPRTDLLLMGKHYDGDFRSLENSSSWYDMDAKIGLFTTSRDNMHIPTDQIQAHLLLGYGDHQFILGSLYHFRNRGLDSESRDEFWQLSEGWWYYLDALESENSNTVHDRYQSHYVQDIWRIAPWLTAEAAFYYDILENHNIYTGVEQNREAVNPRAGLIFSPTSQDTIRVAGFRYLVPFTIERLDPTDIGGVPLFRNAYDNSTSEEYDIVWEHEWETGFVSMGSFYVESEVEETWSDRSSTSWRAYARGVEPAWNQLLWKGMGLGVRYRFLDIQNDYTPEKDRNEHLASCTISYLHPWGFFAGVSEIYRMEDFDRSLRKDENIFLTDLSLGYQFPKKRGLVRIDARNLTDAHFNWVVDDMVFSGRAPERELSATLALYF